jgi:hypothetical protein
MLTPTVPPPTERLTTLLPLGLPKLLSYPLDQLLRCEYSHRSTKTQNPASQCVIITNLHSHHHGTVCPILQPLRRMPRALLDVTRRFADRTGAAPCTWRRDRRQENV